MKDIENMTYEELRNTLGDVRKKIEKLESEKVIRKEKEAEAHNVRLFTALYNNPALLDLLEHEATSCGAPGVNNGYWDSKHIHARCLKCMLMEGLSSFTDNLEYCPLEHATDPFGGLVKMSLALEVSKP